MTHGIKTLVFKLHTILRNWRRSKIIPIFDPCDLAQFTRAASQGMHARVVSVGTYGRMYVLGM